MASLLDLALQRFNDELEEQLLDSIEEAAQEIFAQSQEEVPEVTGDLKRSGEVRRQPDGVRIAYTEDYAATVHENPESEGYRFLEKAVMDANFADNVGQKMQKKWGAK